MITVEESILAFMPEAVIAIAEDDHICFFNGAAERIFGHDRAEALGRPLEILIPESYRPHHSGYVRQFRQSPDRALFMHERRAVVGLRASGETFPMEATLVKEARDGRTLIYAIARDVSEQRARQRALAASEQKYRAILEGSPEPILIADAVTGRVVEVNQAAARLFGCAAAELVGLHQSELHPADTRERFRLTFREHIEAGRIQVADGVILTARGERIAVEINASPIVIEGRTYLVGFFRDMSRQIENEGTLRAALGAAEAAVSAKKLFLANMSHELRTPLNSIIGFSDLIAQEIHGAHAQASYREYGEIIRSSGAHLLGIVNDILDLSSIELGKLPLFEEEIPVAELVEECRRMLERMMADGGIGFAAADAAGLRLFADRRAVKQMLLNLLSNALKFAPRGGTVAVATARAASGEAVLSVSDTGPGIEHSRLTRIAQPFAADADVMTRKEGGTGIGLSITKGLVQLHGGRLEIESEIGRGTTALLLFPAERVRTADAIGVRAARRVGS